MRGNSDHLLSFYEWLIGALLFWTVLACGEVLIAVISTAFAPPLGSGSLPSVRDFSLLLAALSLYALFSIPSALLLFWTERLFHKLSQTSVAWCSRINQMDLCLLLGWGLLSFKWISNLLAYMAPPGKLPVLPYLVIVPLLFCQLLLGALLTKKKGYYRLQWILIVVGAVFFSKRAYDVFIISELGLSVKVSLFVLFLTSSLFVAWMFCSLLHYLLQNRVTPKPSYAVLLLIFFTGGCLFTFYEFQTGKNTINYKPQPAQSENGVVENSHKVVVILVDCLRADHVGCYGYERDISPFIDESSRQGITFTNCITPSSWTIPSVVSLFTGVYPQQHGVNNKKTSIPGKLSMLHEAIERQGIATAAFITNDFLRADFGYERGFSHYFDHYLLEEFMEYVASRLLFFNALLHFSIELTAYTSVDSGWSRWWSFGLPPHNHEKISAQRVTDDVVEWIRVHHERPFYVYVHFMDVHSPYDNRWYPVFDSVSYPHQSFKEKLINVYDGRVLYVDRQIRRIWACLEELNVSDNTLFVVTADHGEEFFDHKGRGHSQTLYEELIRVPLIMRGQLLSRGASIARQVRLIDLPVTILDFLGIEVPDQMGGRSLLPLVAGFDPRGEPSYALSYTTLGRKRFVSSQEREVWMKEHGSEKVILEALRIDNLWKIIRGNDGSTGLFNLREDPGEQHDLSARDLLMLEELEKKLVRESTRWEQDIPSQEQQPLSPDVVNKLRALGYL